MPIRPTSPTTPRCTTVRLSIASHGKPTPSSESVRRGPWPRSIPAFCLKPDQLSGATGVAEAPHRRHASLGHARRVRLMRPRLSTRPARSPRRPPSPRLRPSQREPRRAARCGSCLPCRGGSPRRRRSEDPRDRAGEHLAFVDLAGSLRRSSWASSAAAPLRRRWSPMPPSSMSILVLVRSVMPLIVRSGADHGADQLRINAEAEHVRVTGCPEGYRRLSIFSRMWSVPGALDSRLRPPSSPRGR